VRLLPTVKITTSAVCEYDYRVFRICW